MMLKVEGLEVALGGRRVLDQITFEAARGELICLIGPNGAGKSTLLRSIAGLVEYSGRIELEGRSLRQLAARERSGTVSYLPQSGVVHWPLSVRDVVAIGRLPYSSSLTSLSSQDERAIDHALVLADASEFAGRLITELSGGERARVLLARAIAVESPILLADEPLAALDPEHQLGCLGILSDFAGRGRLVVAALHDIGLAARFADRVIVLQNGTIAADGTPSDVLDEDLLQQVFEVEAVRFEHEGRTVLLPWQRKPQSRDK
ncbi:MAG: hypothetical protein RLZ98_1570 [Pseudomonadota bacterium]|jgi:iron complex transport system ATP-binding protein